MLTIMKASLLGSALMLLESCTGYLTSYQTPCVEGHVCECVQYTTLNRSWLDCRDYGRVKPKAYYVPGPNSSRTVCYHFATQLGSTKWDEAGWDRF